MGYYEQTNPDSEQADEESAKQVGDPDHIPAYFDDFNPVVFMSEDDADRFLEARGDRAKFSSVAAPVVEFQLLDGQPELVADQRDDVSTCVHFAQPYQSLLVDSAFDDDSNAYVRPISTDDGFFYEQEKSSHDDK
jgi:hypothetical protein